MPLATPEIRVATIANGAALSDAVVIGVGEIVALDVPTITSAALTFEGSSDGGTTFRDLYDSAQAEVSIAASTGDRYIQAPAALKGVDQIKVRSGTSGTPVNQGAARLIRLIMK